ncbi:storkhead-box protein 1-like [Canis lupus familiaris]|uniref:storkhead-box protein 1-like n=1 Tax=Canis lupus dingo TaxID=286419 RepID=UPI0006B3D6DC|nr:storkhead-box protein 1-like [Canis lupus dingo]XP_038416366.1 storkhead-box protein 1-like [Canis lupus familiaris]XP_038546182.1 storkhead-box protein 1-like [Canis lupus familiaris]|eukprot:XP_013975608.1 storkhead-box protein 1-like [Canis lupus familiaris]
MQHFWNKRVTAAVAETFFLGWIDEQVLLIQGKEEHLEALREGWTRRALRPPSGFHIRCLGSSHGPVEYFGAEKCLQESNSGFLRKTNP